jgi:hypothetical protein
MYNASLLEPIKFLGFVIDRANIEQAAVWPPSLESPTSKHGWSKGLQLFEESPTAKYLFMVAEDKHRVSLAAPMIGLLDTGRELTAAMKLYAPKAAHFGAAWLFMIDEKVGARLGKIITAVRDLAPIVVKYEANTAPPYEAFLR